MEAQTTLPHSSPLYKVCSRCKLDLDVAQFASDRSRKDGLSYWCKGCQAAHRNANKDQISARMAKYRQNNKQQIDEYNRKWRADNPGWVSRWKKANPEKAAQWLEDNKERLAEYQRSRLAKPEVRAHLSRRQRQRYAANPDFYLRRNREWRINNPGKKADSDRKSKHQRRALGRIPKGWFDEQWKRQRGRCNECRRKRKLTVDHVIPVSKGGINDPVNLVLLCQPCNSRKKDRITRLL